MKTALLVGLLFAFSAAANASDCIAPELITPSQTRMGARECTIYDKLEVEGAAKGRRPISKLERSAIDREVRDQLNDPYSARITVGPQRTRSGFVCGEVNAKNAFGAYIGRRTFMATLDARGGVQFVRIDDTAAGDVAYECRSLGYRRQPESGSVGKPRK